MTFSRIKESRVSVAVSVSSARSIIRQRSSEYASAGRWAGGRTSGRGKRRDELASPFHFLTHQSCTYSRRRVALVLRTGPEMSPSWKSPPTRKYNLRFLRFVFAADADYGVSDFGFRRNTRIEFPSLIRLPGYSQKFPVIVVVVVWFSPATSFSGKLDYPRGSCSPVVRRNNY